jgi:hypothetical protein
MFDDFRSAAEENMDNNPTNSDVGPFSFTDEDAGLDAPQEGRSRRLVRRLSAPAKALGMTPFQNFVITVLLFLMVVICGAFLLLITGKISLF